ncbi:MAG: hypothetical protein AB1469_02945 [Pseudomonadota bacterium]
MTKTAKAAHSDARFKRVVERIGAEAFWLRTYQDAINGMKGVHAIGLDFFRVSLNALKDARLVRLIRVLEDDSQVASFWYLLKCNGRIVRASAKKGGLDLPKLGVAAKDLLAIRNKTFMHIDKDGVFDPQSFYKAAGLTNNDVERIIRGLWSTMNHLHVEVFGKEMQGDEYPGTDIRVLAKLRDALTGRGDR